MDVLCPHCHLSLDCPPNLVGQVVYCPQCSGALTTPLPITGPPNTIATVRPLLPTIQTSVPNSALQSPAPGGVLNSLTRMLAILAVVLLVIQIPLWLYVWTHPGHRGDADHW